MINMAGFQVRRGDLAFDVRTAGAPGGPPVVLLHGFPQNGRCWDAVAQLLAAAGFRTWAPDQRGYSPGARPEGRRAYRLGELAADALAVIDAAADEAGGGGVHLVGHDWGAVIGWRLAARHPDRLATFTAVSVPPPAVYARALLSPRQALASAYVLAFQLPWLPERVLATPPGQQFSERFVRFLQAAGQSRAAAERDAAGLSDPAALTGALNWYRGLAFERGRGPDRTSVPTLFVWSDGDVALTRAVTTGVENYVTGPFRYAELRGVSHWIPDEAPESLARLVIDQVRAATP